MNNNTNTNKVPEYILRNTRKYASNNREKINENRKKKYFLVSVSKIVGNAEYSQAVKIEHIEKLRNYDKYKEDPKFIHDIARKI